MKIMNNWLVRGVSALVLAVAFVVPLVVPASAAEMGVFQADAYTSYNGYYAIPTGDITYLSDIDWVESSNYGNIEAIRDGVYSNGKDIWLGGTSAVDSPVSDGELFYKGLGVMPFRADDGNHGTAATIFDVSGLGVDTFYAVVGITNVNGQNYAYGDEYNGSTFQGGGVVFEVYGDYNGSGSYTLLAESEPITKTMTGEFYVDITGVKYLKLVVRCYLDVYGGHVSMNSAWGNACVYNSDDGNMSNTVGVLDYSDFVSDIQVDGDNDLVTITIPSSMAYWILSGSEGIETSTGKYAGYGYGITVDHSVTFMPLGRNAFILDDFPSGAKLTTSVHITTFGDLHDSDNMVWDSSPFVYYYNDHLSLIDESAVLDADEVWDYENNTISKMFSFTLLDASVASYFSMAARWFDLQFDTDQAIYSCDDTVITFSISSAYAEAQQANKTNKLLQAVEDKLEEQGMTMEEVLDQQQQTNDKLDEIIDSTVAPEAPDGDDTVNDYGDLEEGIMNDMSSNFSDADGYLTSATEIISKYGTALLAVSHLFGIFWKFPFFAELVMVAFAFGMFGTLLGVGFGAISAHNAKVERANRQKGKGG